MYHSCPSFCCLFRNKEGARDAIVYLLCDFIAACFIVYTLHFTHAAFKSSQQNKWWQCRQTTDMLRFHVSSGSVFSFVLWQRRVNAQVRFRHKIHLDRVRKIPCFGLSYLVLLPQNIAGDLSQMEKCWNPGCLSKDTHNRDAGGAAASHKNTKRGIIKTANC